MSDDRALYDWVKSLVDLETWKIEHKLNLHDCNLHGIKSACDSLETDMKIIEDKIFETNKKSMKIR